jgi:hypothetical protein
MEPLYLDLSADQGQQLFSHIFVYFSCLIVQPGKPEREATLEILKEPLYQLFDQHQQGNGSLTLKLTRNERKALRQMFTLLKRYYMHALPSPERTMALEHLVNCRLLLQQAAQEK